jgi:hypothetical protein
MLLGIQQLWGLEAAAHNMCDPITCLSSLPVFYRCYPNVFRDIEGKSGGIASERGRNDKGTVSLVKASGGTAANMGGALAGAPSKWKLSKKGLKQGYGTLLYRCSLVFGALLLGLGMFSLVFGAWGWSLVSMLMLLNNNFHSSRSVSRV